MADLTPEIVDQVVAACQAGANEAAEAFSRALDAELTLSVGESATLEPGKLPEELSGPGLAVVFHCGGTGAAVLLPENSGLLPEWCADPDPTGTSKLATLAQELGVLVLPEDFSADESNAGRVDDLAAAV